MDATESVSASTFPEPLPFSGGTLADCHKFIISIRKYTRAIGRQRQNDWIADYVACCLDGEALLWHLRLPSDVTEDWLKLQIALVEHYSAIDQEPSLKSSDITLVPHADKQTRGVQENPLIRDDARMGVISVCSTSLAQSLYIGDGCSSQVSLTTLAHKAVMLRYTPSRDHTAGSMQLEQPQNERSVLGLIRRIGEDSDDVWADDCFYITSLYPACARHIIPSGRCYPERPVRSLVWKISADDVVTLSWGGADLLPLVTSDPVTRQSELYLVVDTAKFVERFGVPGLVHEPARLVFED